MDRGHALGAEAPPRSDLVSALRDKCETCDSPTHWHAAWAGETLCLPCARAALAHGHKHSHDEHEDCKATLDDTFGGKGLVIRCPTPVKR